MSPPAVEVIGLSKSFGSRAALESIDLCVEQGTAFGFLGPNGAGKTTLIRLLLGLTDPTRGTIELLGLAQPKFRAKTLQQVGAIIEEPRFHGHLTGRENLLAHAAARDLAASQRISGALQRVELAPRADDLVSTYSLGMRQRLGIARCLLCDPKLLILDEPTNGLDPEGIIDFRELVRSLVSEGRTVWLSSHLLDEVEKTCDTAAIVVRGRVVAEGTMAELLGPPERAVEIVAAPVDRARAVLLDSGLVAHVSQSESIIRVQLEPDAPAGPAPVDELLRRLIGEDVSVERISPIRPTLESRYLNMTGPQAEPADV